MEETKLPLFDSLNIRSPKINGIRVKKLQSSSPYAKLISSPKTSKSLFLESSDDGSTEEYICMICLECLQSSNTQFTNCGHIFHSNCLKLWYKTRNEKSCPLCRNDDIFDAPLLPVQQQPQEDKENFEEYDNYESLQQSIMTSLFQLWPISTFSNQQPKDLWNMSIRSFQASQKAFKAGQILLSYRFLRRSMHLHNGIQFCENSSIFMKLYGPDYTKMETYFIPLIKKFDDKFETYFSKINALETEIHCLQKEFIERCSTKFTFSL